MKQSTIWELFLTSSFQVFYGVDFGGTNIRATRVELHGKGTATTKRSSSKIMDDVNAKHLSKGLKDKHATASMLFDSIADQVKKEMEKNVRHFFESNWDRSGMISLMWILGHIWCV